MASSEAAESQPQQGNDAVGVARMLLAQSAHQLATVQQQVAAVQEQLMQQQAQLDAGGELLHRRTDSTDSASSVHTVEAPRDVGRAELK